MNTGKSIKEILDLDKCRAHGVVDRGVVLYVKGPGFDSFYCHPFSSQDLFELVPWGL